MHATKNAVMSRNTVFLMAMSGMIRPPCGTSSKTRSISAGPRTAPGFRARAPVWRKNGKGHRAGPGNNFRLSKNDPAGTLLPAGSWIRG